MPRRGTPGVLSLSLSFFFENDDIADTTPLRIENRCPSARVKADRSKVKRRRVNLSPDDLKRARGVCVSQSMTCNVSPAENKRYNAVRISKIQLTRDTHRLSIVSISELTYSHIRCSLILLNLLCDSFFFENFIYFLNIIFNIFNIF